jgi:hypothetical protein
MLAACGAEAEPNRLDLRTPGANTGAPVETTPVPTPTPELRKPVTAAEKRVIKAWSDNLRKGRVVEAARYFTVPAYVSSNSPDYQPLHNRAAIEDFNRTLNCGSKLLRTRRGAENFVVGIFRLTERGTAGTPGCGQGIGKTAAVAFEIKKGHIERWVQVDPNAVEPSATPAPSTEPKTG